MRWLTFLIAAQLFGATLADVQAVAAKLRAQREGAAFRDRPPELIELKHALRAWIESRLDEAEDPNSLSSVLTAELDQGGLSCDKESDDEGLDLRGCIGGIRLLRLDPGWLSVTTAAGVVCGVEESVYFYQRIGGRWSRRVESEQDIEGELEAVGGILKISPVDARGRRLLLTVGTVPQCASSWRVARYRLWRISEQTDLLLDATHSLYIGDRVEPSSLTPDEVTIHFGVATRRYRVSDAGLIRLEPIASSPGLFIEEWRASQWSDVAAWTAPSLSQWHQRLHTESMSGMWNGDEVRCQQPNRWQLEDGRLYYLVEQGGESSFFMLDIGESPRPGCSQ